jgi:hypothetical protein
VGADVGGGVIAGWALGVWAALDLGGAFVSLPPVLARGFGAAVIVAGWPGRQLEG